MHGLARDARSPRSRKAAAAALLALLALAGCDREPIQEERVPKGVEPTTPTPDQPAAESPAPAGTVPTPGATTPPDDPAAPWTVPDGWALSPEPRPMRIATFTVPVQGQSIEVAVTRFEGQTGGVLANVNRWRTQMGLPPIDEAALESTITRFGPGEWPGYLVRVAGAEQHMLAAGVFERAADRTWFVRASGTPQDIEALAADFELFARSIGQAGAP
jgi:hypothetical protein